MSQLRPRQQRSKFIDADDPARPEHVADRTMRFKLFWKHPGEDDSKAVEESYEKITDNPEQWSRDIIAWFNKTLRPGERKREFIRCEVLGEVPPAEHKWAKSTAMTQQIGDRTPFDKMQCERCGITGKRYGLSAHVKIDSKFRLKVFKRCDTSMAHKAAATGD